MKVSSDKKAFIYMLISTFSFAVMGMFVRLSGEIPLYEKVFFRNFIILIIISTSIFRSKSISFLGKRENRKLLILRSVLGLAGVFTFFYAIDNLYLSDSAILNKISPFFVVLFSALILKTKTKRITYLLLTVAFTGALLIIKPQMNYTLLPALSGLVSAMFAGLAYTIINLINNRERSETIIFYFSAFSVLVTLPLLLIEFKIPSLIQLAYLILVGVFASSGQYFLTFAYKTGNAGRISILNYFGVVISLILGIIFFAEIPDIFSIIGTTLIIMSVFLLYKSK